MSDRLIYRPLISDEGDFSNLVFRTPRSIATVPETSILMTRAADEGWIPKETGQQTPTVTLNEHNVSSNAYSRDIHGKTSWISGLFTAEAKVSLVGVIQEAKHYRTMELDGKKVEVGVSVRLEVEATTFSSKVQVTVPNIAAEAQLGMSSAQMEISVRGFVGSLGKLLPVPSTLDLESYASYISAFEKIQEHVFSEEGMKSHAPVVLGELTQDTAGV